MTDDRAQFQQQVAANVQKLAQSKEMKDMGVDFVRRAGEFGYSYNFSWMGVPVIQFPQDIMAMQELIWRIQPDVIVETGIARGGSLVFYAGMLEMMGIRDGRVIGVDIDIRPHNRATIEEHPMGKRIQLVQGSSTAPETVEEVKKLLQGAKKVLVCLDSMHTHQHVLDELRLYAPLVTQDSYLVVFDTLIEEMPADYYPDRPWSHGDNPMTAVKAFLSENKDFVEDDTIPAKLLITVARGGYLKRIA